MAIEFKNLPTMITINGKEFKAKNVEINFSNTLSNETLAHMREDFERHMTTRFELEYLRDDPKPGRTAPPPPAIDLGGLRILKIEAGLYMTRDSYGVQVVAQVADRKTGKPIQVEGIFGAVYRDIYEAWTARERGRWVKKQIMAVLEHEIDEWLRVDGVQVTDPHPEARG